jgi:uncharacterized protein with PQ loop repeat
MLNLIGWLGAICFSFCGLPQAYKSYKDGHSDGISILFLFLWFLGEFFSIIYTFNKHVLPLFCNYILNIIFLLIIIKYKFFRRNKNA